MAVGTYKQNSIKSEQKKKKEASYEAIRRYYKGKKEKDTS